MPKGPSRDLLSRIWADEIGHARFGWQMLEALLPSCDDAERAAIARYLPVALRHLEAHEIAMFGYPKAFGSGDPNEVKEVESWWVVVEAKTKKYAESLGGTWKAPVCDAATPKAKPKKKTK